jgi:predicted RNA-binding protein
MMSMGPVYPGSANRIRAVVTWVLTGSLENFRVYAQRGFDLIAFKERRRRLAAEIEPGDEVVFYVTKLQAFGAIARVCTTMFEDRERFLPEGAKKDEDYPWRVEAEPLVVLPEDRFVPAQELVSELEHTRKWPAEHWHLAFQGQLRAVSEHDGLLLRDRLEAAAAASVVRG